MNTDQEHSLPRLGDPVPSGIQQRVPDDVALFAQFLGHHFRHVGAAVIQDVGHVLHEKRQRLCVANVRKVVLPQIHAPIHEKCGLRGDLLPSPSLVTQLRPTYPGEGLTRRTADQDIDLFVDGAGQPDVLEDARRALLGDVARPEVGFEVLALADLREVGTVRLRSPRVQLHRRYGLEACRRETERDSAASREEINESWRLA